ncbi:Crp/Fnr family transcriptional regulator [Bradyrhizobium genosp. P]|uniref:Crp/Fnr family transcriptional regulator n=1 Tax=Bradyrhizobium genosp. P TaxID=83641 RepID=UPI003CF96CC7
MQSIPRLAQLSFHVQRRALVREICARQRFFGAENRTLIEKQTISRNRRKRRKTAAPIRGRIDWKLPIKRGVACDCPFLRPPKQSDSPMPRRKLTDRLQIAVGLSEHDQDLLSKVPKTIRSFADREPIVRLGESPTRCVLLIEGFAIRQKVVAGYNRILAFYVPGDAPDLHALHLPVMDHDLTSAGPATAAFISHANIRTMLRSSYSLTDAFWRETLVDAAIYREWVANVGARNAIGRIAHVVCELAARLEIVGLLKDNVFEPPFTQANMPDACGLSNVHVNRSLQELRHRGLIKWQGRTVTLLNRRGLEAVAEFQPEYLHQDQ